MTGSSDKSQKLPIDLDGYEWLDKMLLKGWPTRQPTRFEYRGFADPEQSDPIDDETKRMVQAHTKKLNEISTEIRQKLKEFCDRLIEGETFKQDKFKQPPK